MIELSKKEVERRINAAFRALEREALKVGSGFNLFERSERVAEQGELEYRRLMRRGGAGHVGYRQSVVTTARYFVCRWYAGHEPGRQMTAKDAAGMRADALLASALRDLIPECPFDAAKLLEIDYADHIAPDNS
jgi:hypothetical protein